jgi:hypothetical protein
LQSAVGKEQDGEGDAINKITFCEPSGFLGEAVDPFETESLDPERSTEDFAGDEAEADTDPHPPHIRKIRSQSIDHFFLFSGPEAHVDNRGL